MTRRWLNMMSCVWPSQEPSLISPIANYFAECSRQPIANSLKGFQQKFTGTATTLRYISTNGLRLFLQFWYAKAAMFWIPQGWVPSYVEWMLSFPRAPMGSVSIQIWGISCASVVGVVGSAVVAAVVLVQERRMGRKKEAMGMAGGKEAS